MTHPSFWFSQLKELPKRDVLENDLAVDVAIVGAGFTGLWTAYYLKKAAPQISIAILEKNHVGFGASGRNGGWCSALFATSLEKLAKKSNPENAKKQYQEMVKTLDEIENVLSTERIDAEWQRGGTITVARDQIQLQRAHSELNHLREWGFDESYLKPLSKKQASEIFAAANVLGGTFSPHCAAINPAKLVLGLAEVIEKMGVKIYEYSPVIDIAPNLITGKNFKIHTRQIVKALEAFTPTFKKYHRDVIPVYSLMIATEKLPQEVIKQIGLSNRTTFADFRNTIIYGQRTIDDRIVFGGRGAPYSYGSKINSKLELHHKTHKDLEKTLKELIPQLHDFKISHTWGGPLGISRDWSSHVSFDLQTQIASAGGYVGDGVGTSNLAGRTLTDLLLNRDSAITRLPWVNHKSRKWEPEPFRYLGVNLGTLLAKSSDRLEKGKSKPSLFSSLLKYLIK